ncbi:MAG: hypothetical protein P4M14_11665 [Gammaproteobacteria bacterium]|nr:hypothetical protein [Gammaproteobacteria bacterium]
MSDISAEEKDLLCQHYLNRLYQGTKGHQSPELIKQASISETYGEILFPSIDKLLSMVMLTDQDVFVDYGSGIGKITAQVFLKTAVKEAIGIELLPALHEQAEAAGKRLLQELPGFYENGRKLTFILGDFLKTPLPNATVAVVCAPCFPQVILNALGQILNDTESIHTIFTLRPISTIKRLAFKRAVRVEGSWDTSLCYIYGASKIS